jgi:hypothetical protein
MHSILSSYNTMCPQKSLLGYSSGHAPKNMARARILSERSPSYQGSQHRGLLKSVKYFQGFTIIYSKPHMARSICLRGHNFSKPRRDFVDTLYYLKFITNPMLHIKLVEKYFILNITHPNSVHLNTTIYYEI